MSISELYIDNIARLEKYTDELIDKYNALKTRYDISQVEIHRLRTHLIDAQESMKQLSKDEFHSLLMDHAKSCVDTMVNRHYNIIKGRRNIDETETIY